MSFVLPSFSDTYCRALTVCGLLKADKLPDILESFKKPRIARYGSREEMTYVRAWLATKRGAHLHIDCALKNAFAEGSVPKTNCKRAEMASILSKFVGHRADVGISGVFEVPSEKLPEHGIIRSLSQEQSMLGMTLRLTGGRLDFSGAAISQMNWEMSLDKKKVPTIVTLRGERQINIGESYLEECLDWIDEQFRFFITGRKTHD